MKRFVCWLACVFAIIIFFKSGERVLVRDGVGVVWKDVEGVLVVAVLDRDAEVLGAFPLELVEGALFIPDRSVCGIVGR